MLNVVEKLESKAAEAAAAAAEGRQRALALFWSWADAVSQGGKEPTESALADVLDTLGQPPSAFADAVRSLRRLGELRAAPSPADARAALAAAKDAQGAAVARARELREQADQVEAGGHRELEAARRAVADAERAVAAADELAAALAGQGAPVELPAPAPEHEPIQVVSDRDQMVRGQRFRYGVEVTWCHGLPLPEGVVRVEDWTPASRQRWLVRVGTPGVTLAGLPRRVGEEVVTAGPPPVHVATVIKRLDDAAEDAAEPQRPASRRRGLRVAGGRL